MSSAIRNSLVVLALVMPSVASAQSAPTDATVSVAPDAIKADTVLFGALQRKLNIVELQRKIKESQAAQQDNSEESGGTSSGTSKGLPELIGIYGASDRLVADFRVGAAVLRASPGDFVTADWRLKSVLSNGVVIERKGQTRTILFGSRGGPAPAALAQAAPVWIAPPPAMQPAASQLIRTPGGTSVAPRATPDNGRVIEAQE